MRAIITAIFDEIEFLLLKINAVKQIDSSCWIVEQVFNEPIILKCIGIGYLSAAVELQKLLQHYPINDVLLIGSAGAYSKSNLDLLDVCKCKDTLLCDMGAINQHSKTPEKMELNRLTPQSIDHFNFFQARVITTLGVTIDDSFANKIQNFYQADVENMETFGVAYICQNYQIPWQAVLGITNIVGKKGHDQWKKNYQLMAKKIIDQIYPVLLINSATLNVE